MNILVCIPCLLTGGTEIQTLSLVNALTSSGNNVEVACYFEWAPEMVSRFEETGAKVYIMSPSGTRPKGIRQTATLLWKGFRKIIKDTKPDVVHVQYMTPAALAIIILRSLGIKKIIATSHTNADIYSPNGLRLIKLLTRTCLTAFQCITLRAEESYFGSARLFDGKLSPHFTIYNSLPSHIEIRKKPRPLLRNDDIITIGVVSRLELIKGMDLVIPAFAKIASEYPHTYLLVVGDGSLKTEMERQASESGFADRIEFTGRKPQSRLSDCYDCIDILLIPSRSEGFGLTTLEGMARGCVPVVADIGGLPEVVREDIDGLLHTPDSSEDIASTVSSLLSDLSLLNTFRMAVLSRARSFSVQQFARRIDSLYSLLS